MKRPTAAHIKLLRCAKEGDSMYGAAHLMQRTDAMVEKLFYELIDANMIEAGARDEPMVITRLGRAVLKGGPRDLQAGKKRPPNGAVLSRGGS